MTTQPFIEIIYLVASALFILSLKWMSAPATARRGVWAGEIGMAVAIGGTLLHHGIVIVGTPYIIPELTDMTEIVGGGPYGAGTLAGGDGKRQP